MEVAEDDPLQVGNDVQMQVAVADPGPLMPNLDILLLTSISCSSCIFVSPLHCVKVYVVAEKYAHVPPLG